MIYDLNSISKTNELISEKKLYIQMFFKLFKENEKKDNYFDFLNQNLCQNTNKN